METGLQLNEKVIRLNALLTIILASFVLILNNEWLALLLSIDFFIRGFTNLPSPFAFFSKLIVKFLNLTHIPVYAPPKKFAAKVGFIFTSLIFVFLINEWEILTIIVAIVLIVCAFLEAFLKICVGCYVYDWVFVPFVNKRINNKILSK
jgi:hypothetical protein